METLRNKNRLRYIILLVVFQTMIFSSIFGDRYYYYDQKVKTTEDYGVIMEGGYDWVHSFWVSVLDFSSSGSVTIAPGSGDPGFSQNVIIIPSCPYSWVGSQLTGDYSFTFNSLTQLGTWEIFVDTWGAFPDYCIYNGCIPVCDPGAVYDSTNNLYYYITVWNDPPTASISHSPTPAWNNTVTLHANSDDPDGGSLDHTWTIVNKPSGSSKTLSSSSSANPTITFTNDDDIGHWEFRLHVDDNEGERVTYYHSFDVPNVPPNISINGATNIFVLDDILLEVTPTTDVDGGNLIIVWDIMSTPTNPQPQLNYHTGSQLPPIPTTEADIGDWVFRATARDDEDPPGEDSDSITVTVNNIVPVIDLIGNGPIIPVGDTMWMETTIIDDIDGGELSFQWDIIQAPQSSSIPVQYDYHVENGSAGAYIEIPTSFNDAGTWIFALTATDNEGDYITEEYTILVDAPPTADISCVTCDSGNTIGSFSFPLELDGSVSIDPDSPCPGMSHKCHDTLDGRIPNVSNGVTSYCWSLLDIPPDRWGDIPLGYLDDVFGVSANGESVSLNFGMLSTGEWTFQMEIADAEGNSDFATITIQVIDENTAPIAILSPPARYNTDAIGTLFEDIIISGAESFDLDNLLAPGTGTGITDYSWEIVNGPAGCTFPTLPSGGLSDTITLFFSGPIDVSCQGTWTIGLTVTDDDMPAKTGYGETTIIIGNCPQVLCIDSPTTLYPEFVEFTDLTDILIYYHLDSVLYDDPVFLSGAFTLLSIYHESDLTTPVFTSYDPNVLASDKGGFLVFNWNGYTNSFARPESGRYTINISMLDFAFSGTAYSATEAESIIIAVAEPEILPASDDFIVWDALDPGTDTIDIHYSVSGAAVPDEYIFRVTDASSIVIFEDTIDGSGVFNWDGKPGGITIPPGDYSVEIEIFKLGASLGISNIHPLSVLRTDIDVDADRDTIVEDTDEDELGEDTFTVGPGTKGAIVLVNSDDDDGNHIPDNWSGGDFDFALPDEPADTIVNADPDKDDLAPLVVRKTGLNTIPPSLKLVLTVVLPPGDPPYFTAEAPLPQDRVRIFLPTLVSGSNLVIQAGDTEIIGPNGAASVDFVTGPSPPQQDIAIFQGTGEVVFGVEGLHYNCEVDVTIELYDAATKLYEDRVRMKSAPFILTNHTIGVDVSPGAGETVYVDDLGLDNADVRTQLRTEYTTTHLDEATTTDRWHQDGYEIGYTKAPYGSMSVIFGLPRGERWGNLLNTYTRQVLMRSGIGLIHRFQQIGFIDQDDGGNLECIPSSNQYLYGIGMNSMLTDFLDAQGLQTPRNVDLGFLAVGHIDELVSYCPDGVRVLVASPEVGWALVVIANDIDPAVTMLAGIDPFGAGGTDVAAFVAGTHRDYNVDILMDPLNLPDVLTTLAIPSPVSTPAAAGTNTGSGSLSKGGGLVGFFPNNNTRQFKITFLSAADYIIEYQEAGSTTWNTDGTGSISDDMIATSRTAFILSGWWSGTPDTGDIFTFSVNPTSNTIEVPVLFRDIGGAIALTNNNVNSLVDGTRIVTAETWGPQVDLGSGPVDIFGEYVEAIFNMAGYTNVVFADDRVTYHNNYGSIHCGTNVTRVIPAANWWE